MLEFRDVIKKYPFPEAFALNGISVKFEKGRTYLLAAPDGHGKSTLMKAACNLIKIDSGVCRFNGKPVSYRTNKHIAYMPAEMYFYSGMSTEDAGKYYRDLYSDFRYADFGKLIKRMNINPKANISEMFAGTYSKFRLCIALSRNTDVIMIDEPLYKTEPIDHEIMIQAINDFIDPKACLILSCSSVSELRCLADNIVIMKKGQNALEGEIEKLENEQKISLSEIYGNEFSEMDFEKYMTEITDDKSY